jgi:7-carboxy-7-deazaguanine synthase
MAVDTLRITEIFHSLQGESLSVGAPTVFVRLTGCPLRCHYCDSAYAFHGGEKQTIEQILATVKSFSCDYVCVTGGEPLAQRECIGLLQQLCDQGYRVSIETSGALSVAQVDPRVVKVLDLKTPASGECARNDYANLSLLTPQDQVKFVICDYDDYQWARMTVDQYRLTEKVAAVLFSPSFEQVNPADLAAWILEDRLRVRMQLQMHKQLWGDEPGR